MTNSADLHCLQRQGISGFSRTRVKLLMYGSYYFCLDTSRYTYHLAAARDQYINVTDLEILLTSKFCIRFFCVASVSENVHWKFLMCG